MSDDSRSHFELERGGVRIELTGSWSFIEHLYRRVMRDVERSDLERSRDSGSVRSTPLDRAFWIIRCSDMMRRIYMAELRDLEESPLSEVLDAESLGTLYIEKSAFEELLPNIAEGESTLWARLTELGRRELTEGLE